MGHAEWPGGWLPVDFGAVDFSGYLEALAMLWVRYGRQTGVWSHAFRVSRKA